MPSFSRWSKLCSLVTSPNKQYYVAQNCFLPKCCCFLTLTSIKSFHVMLEKKIPVHCFCNFSYPTSCLMIWNSVLWLFPSWHSATLSFPLFTRQCKMATCPYWFLLVLALGTQHRERDSEARENQTTGVVCLGDQPCPCAAPSLHPC